MDESLTDEREKVARQIANEIKHLRTGLAVEDGQAEGIVHRSYARSKKLRDQDRAKIQGMVIAMTYALGRPNDMQLAEQFIADAPTWRALLA